MMDAITLENVSKEFIIGFKKKDRAVFKISNLIKGFVNKKKFVALSNINLVVKAGDKIGVIGENGSGKSTLLRIIAGIYQPTSGSVTTNGNLMYISGFGLGLNQKLTFRENIYLIGSLMGLSNRQIKSKLKEIIDFSGLEEFLDAKLEYFSTGMLARAGFSIRLFFIDLIKPEIILLDEATSGGGDAEFCGRANKKIAELIQSSSTIVLTSHSSEQVTKFCKKVVWLDSGKIREQGEAVASILNKYTDSFRQG